MFYKSILNCFFSFCSHTAHRLRPLLESENLATSLRSPMPFWITPEIGARIRALAAHANEEVPLTMLYSPTLRGIIYDPNRECRRSPEQVTGFAGTGCGW